MLETLISQALYGISYGLLLFMLAAGLTLIFSMMGVLNFAHASFYMLGAYIAYQISTWIGFWPALILAPVALFVIGALVERWGLRRVHKWGHVPELLFMLAAGLTLIFSMMGVLNFAHASFYMLGAYIAYQISTWIGFWPALILAPVALFVIGALVERWGLRRVHKWGHVPELLFTFGLSYIIVELVQVIWGRQAVAYRVPAELDGPVDWMQYFGITFPEYRMFMMAVAIAMLVALWLVLTRTRIGLVIQAALTHPQQVEALGHNVPRVFMLVFGAGSALAGLAGVVGGNAFVTQPDMANTVGAIIFVIIIVGGLGSLTGAFVAALLIGLLENFGKAEDGSLATLLTHLGLHIGPDTPGYAVLSLTLSEVTPVLPYLLLVLILIVRPKGLLGTREN